MNMLTKFKLSKWWLVLLIPIFSCFLCWITFILLFEKPFSPCSKEPCSVSEIRARLVTEPGDWPIYIPQKNSPYADLVPVFYFDDWDERRLRTRFGSAQRGARIAEIRTSWFSENTEGYLKDSIEVKVYWANNSSARTCQVIPGHFFDTYYANYRTCIVGMVDILWFNFYSTLPLDETLVLINSLEEVER